MVPGRNYAAKVMITILGLYTLAGICKGWHDSNPPVTISNAVIEYADPVGNPWDVYPEFHTGPTCTEVGIKGFDGTLRFPSGSVQEGDIIENLKVRKIFPFSRRYRVLSMEK